MFLKDLSIANELYDAMIEFDDEFAYESDRQISTDIDDDDLSIALTQEDEEDILNDTDDDDLDDDLDELADESFFLNDLDLELAMEGIFRSKENVEKSENMKAKELLPFFVASKGISKFGTDTELLRTRLKEAATKMVIGKYSIVHVENIPFAVIAEGAYYLQNNNKLMDITISKLRSIASRSMTKSDRAKNGIFGNKK